MHSLSLAATTLFVAGALASNLNQLLPRELQVRQDTTQVQGQDQSFTPTTDYEYGATCADAFGAGSVQCSSSRYCYFPGLGGDCCTRDANAIYSCPPGNYCLVNGECCPRGLPAETCAEQLNIALPGDFTDTANTADTPSPPSPANPVGPTTIPEPTPFPVPGNVTVPGGPAAPSGTGASPPVVPFTGAAGSVKVYCGALVAGVLGVVGMVL